VRASLPERPVSLVTGCSSGIGRALARELAHRGGRCFASARGEAAVADLAAEGLEALRLDVADPASVRAAVAAVVEREGRIDLLVNNAGQSLFGPLAEVPLARLDALLASNVRGPLAVAQAVAPVMARQGGGRIANVGSLVGVVPTPWVGAYAASKAAVHTLSEVLRMELAPFGIDVVDVQPGAVRSEVASKAPLDLDVYGAPGGLYRDALGALTERAHASQRRPMEADVFARRLADALLARRAPRRVRLGGGVAPLAVLARLPGAVRDRLFARVFGLARLGPPAR